MIRRSIVVGVFDDKGQAGQAVGELRRAGFGSDQIGIIARDADVRADVTQAGLEDGNESNAEEAVSMGAAGGVGIGVLWGLGIAAGLLPAVGPVIVGGTLAAILASAAVGLAAGGLVGGLVGILVGWGVPEEEAQTYEADLRAGRILVVVQTENRADQAADLLATAGGHVLPQVTPAR